MAKKKNTKSEEVLDAEESTFDPVQDAEEQMAPFDTLVGVAIHPRATFERMRDAAAGHWWVVVVASLLVALATTVVTVPIQAEAARSALQAQQEDTEAYQGLSEEEMAQVEQVQNIFTSQAMLGALGFFGGVIMLFLGYGVRAGIVFLLGMALGGRASFGQVWRMSVWTTLPDVLRGMVSIGVILATGSVSVSGMSYVLTSAEVSAHPYLAAFLGSIDIYLIWSLALLLIGILVTSQLDRLKSAIVALVCWLFPLAISMGFIALGQAVGSAFGVG